MRPNYDVVVPFAMQRMACTGCGAEVNAACSCGKPYILIKDRAKQAIEADPKKSDRQIAQEIGASRTAVRKAREEVGTSAHLDHRTGLDGKSYPARSRSEPVEDDGDSDETIWRRGLIYRATNAIGEAKYEDWSKFTVDRELVTLAEQAAEAWIKTAKYLRELLDEKV